MSQTVCRPVTRWRCVAGPSVVLGRKSASALGLDVREMVEESAVESAENGDVDVFAVAEEDDDDDDDEPKLNVYAITVANAELLLLVIGAAAATADAFPAMRVFSFAFEFAVGAETETRLLARPKATFSFVASIGTPLPAAKLGETRYARPYRPVNPLLMIWLVRAREALHLAQEMCAVWPERYDGRLCPRLCVCCCCDSDCFSNWFWFWYRRGGDKGEMMLGVVE